MKLLSENETAESADMIVKLLSQGVDIYEHLEYESCREKCIQEIIQYCVKYQGICPTLKKTLKNMRQIIK